MRVRLEFGGVDDLAVGHTELGVVLGDCGRVLHLLLLPLQLLRLIVRFTFSPQC